MSVIKYGFDGDEERRNRHYSSPMDAATRSDLSSMSVYVCLSVSLSLLSANTRVRMLLLPVPRGHVVALISHDGVMGCLHRLSAAIHSCNATEVA